MLDFLVDLILDSIVAAFSWFTAIYDAIPGAVSLLIGMFVVFLSYRFFLMPLVHGDGFKKVRGSDTAKKERK